MLRNNHRGKREGQVAARSGSFVERHERKFEVRPQAAKELLSAVSRHLPRFEFLPGFPYTYVTTVYFDTRDRTFYQSARKSYDNHQKFRVKEYCYRNRDGSFHVLPYRFMELKERRRGLVVKRRIPLPKERVMPFLEGAASWEDVVHLYGARRFEKPDGELESAYSALRDFLGRYTVIPTSVIQYRRAVYQQNEADLRVTFDDKISVHSAGDGLLEDANSLAPPALSKPVRRFERVILEIKCPEGAYPDWLSTALKDYSSRKLSKFTTSIRFLDESSGRLAKLQTSDDSAVDLDASRRVSEAPELDDTSSGRIQG